MYSRFVSAKREAIAFPAWSSPPGLTRASMIQARAPAISSITRSIAAAVAPALKKPRIRMYAMESGSHA